jgi:ATP-dependent RNA helicase MSS116
MCFSATVPPKIKDVLSYVLKSDYISISTLDESEPPTINGVPQFSVVIQKAEDIFPALLTLLNAEIHTNQGDSKIIVFGTTANLVALYAGLYGQLLPMKIFELHSRLNQNQRTKTSDAFKVASSGIMFATDGNTLLQESHHLD